MPDALLFATWRARYHMFLCAASMKLLHLRFSIVAVALVSAATEETGYFVYRLFMLREQQPTTTTASEPHHPSTSACPLPSSYPSCHPSPSRPGTPPPVLPPSPLQTSLPRAKTQNENP